MAELSEGFMLGTTTFLGCLYFAPVALAGAEELAAARAGVASSGPTRHASTKAQVSRVIAVLALCCSRGMRPLATSADRRR